MKQFWIFLAIFTATVTAAQTAEEQVLLVKSRLDSIESFSATLKLHVDISFIQMPDKEATVRFKKGEELVLKADDFTLIPKRGLDLSFRELFEYPFIVVERGEVRYKSQQVQSVSILPASDKANFSVATLYLDIKNQRIVWAEINTKKDGTYALQLNYPNVTAVLPTRLDVSFEMNRIRIPLNFAGKDVQIDRKKMREADQKSGKIILDLVYTNIKKIN
jgi:outer membrane lipoprotein-sorting protein